MLERSPRVEGADVRGNAGELHSARAEHELRRLGRRERPDGRPVAAPYRHAEAVPGEEPPAGREELHADVVLARERLGPFVAVPVREVQHAGRDELRLPVR